MGNPNDEAFQKFSEELKLTSEQQKNLKYIYLPVKQLNVELEGLKKKQSEISQRYVFCLLFLTFYH